MVVLIEIGIAPCDTCGRELMTDQKLGAWYFGSGCNDIHGDGCGGHADTDNVHDDIIDIH